MERVDVSEQIPFLNTKAISLANLICMISFLIWMRSVREGSKFHVSKAHVTRSFSDACEMCERVEKRINGTMVDHGGNPPLPPLLFLLTLFFIIYFYYLFLLFFSFVSSSFFVHFHCIYSLYRLLLWDQQRLLRPTQPRGSIHLCVYSFH